VNDEVDLDDYDLSEDDLNSIKVSGTHEYFEDYLEELISNNIEFDYETLEDTLDKQKDVEIVM
jgi:hypothetical protein